MSTYLTLKYKNFEKILCKKGKTILEFSHARVFKKYFLCQRLLCTTAELQHRPFNRDRDAFPLKIITRICKISNKKSLAIKIKFQI